MGSRDHDQLVRTSVARIDRILGARIKVLDDGFVRVIDYMGSDESIVQSARISYGSGTKRIHDDRGLIRYLMRHGHTTPFEMCEIKLHVRVPMDCWRQWIRHRTASVNEYSTRYSEAIDAAQQTEAHAWRKQSELNRQGSTDLVDLETGQLLSRREGELQASARNVYRERIAKGVAREQARKDLPLCTYTEAYWKIDLHNLLHFLELRMADRAQLEIRCYANVIANDILKHWCPIAWEAFYDYRLHGLRLTSVEKRIVNCIVRSDRNMAIGIATQAGWLKKGKDGLRRNREREECEYKLSELGMKTPWLMQE